MMRVFKEKDLKTNHLKGASVAIVGYGNQGHAHALNLKDSGVKVVVGARRRGDAWSRAETDGFRPLDVQEAVSSADYVVLLVPDEVQGDVYKSEIEPALRPGATLAFAHGFSVAFGIIQLPEDHDVILVAPKGQGHFLRRAYREKTGLPCLVAVEADATGLAMQKALSYAGLLGCLRAGAIETTFRDEAVTDLFGEQVVLCGGVPALVKAAFDTLVEGGYPPEVAYIECLHELKIIADLVYEGGISYMKKRISRTAAWGSYLAEGQMVSEKLKATMKSILEKIESGEFAEGWQREAISGQGRLKDFIDNEAKHAIESAGVPVRELMHQPKEDDQ